MPSPHATAASPVPGAHSAESRHAFASVRAARRKLPHARPHRALTALRVTPWLVAQATILPLLLCAALLWARPALLAFWRECILLWSPGLGLPFTAGDGAQLQLAGLAAGPLPGPRMLLATAAACLAGLWLSLHLSGAKLPLRYLVRIVCAVQLVAVLVFWLAPESFPYGIARHSEELLTIGHVVMVAIPVMLGMGYYILKQGIVAKLWRTGLILLFFAVMVPHQVLAQALILQHMSVLFMPVLYICFGAVFDALMFAALYSWTVSDLPADATI